jgi:hypothetical protein
LKRAKVNVDQVPLARTCSPGLTAFRRTHRNDVFRRIAQLIAINVHRAHDTLRLSRRCPMLVLTRRAGESLLIGDNIELQIVDVDWPELETRCAIQVTDDEGYEVALRCTKLQDGVAVVEVL